MPRDSTRTQSQLKAISKSVWKGHGFSRAINGPLSLGFSP